jgi:hypothetical protein
VFNPAWVFEARGRGRGRAARSGESFTLNEINGRLMLAINNNNWPMNS